MEARAVVLRFGVQDTGVDRKNKWRLMPPSRDLLNAGAGEINAMKHLAMVGGGCH